jgi:hypothetical protein
VKEAFDHYEPLPDVNVYSHGVKVRMIRPFKCTGFKGMHRPTAEIPS